MTHATPDVPDALAEHIRTARVALTLSPVDDPDHKLIHANQALADLTGYEPEEFIGRNCRFLQQGLTSQPATERIRRFLGSQETQLSTQIVNFRKDGSAFINLLFLVRLFDSRRRPKYILGSQFDIGTARISAAEARQGELVKNLEEVAALGPDRRVSMIGSVLAIGSAAGQIAQARLTLAGL